MIAALIADSESNEEEKDNQQKKVQDIEDFLLAFNPPDLFRGSGRVLIQVDKAFENLCTVLEEAGINAPKKLSVYEFYSKVEYFEKKNKK